MKRSAKIELEYSFDEIKSILQVAISRNEKVKILNAVINTEKNTLILSCEESTLGHLTNNQDSKIDIPIERLFHGVAHKHAEQQRNSGISKYLMSLFTDGSIIPLSKVVEYCKIKGFNVTTSSVRKVLLYNTFKGQFVETNPNIFQLKSFFDRSHNR